VSTRFFRNMKLLIILVHVCGLLMGSAFAAETATLSGIVRDPQDASITNAEVTVHEQSTGTDRHTSTNNNGLFSAPSLPPGTYSIKISAAGFKTAESTDIHLGVAEVKQMDFTLEVGAISQTVSVESNSPIINTSDASVGLTVDSDFVENLPLNGHSFQQLITLAPGVNLTGSTSDYGEFSVNGQRATSNYFTVDGVNANLGFGTGYLPGTGEGLNAAGGTNALVSVDALQEFRILTNSFAPEYGRTPGGQVILLTRSGGNDFHGSVFEYFRNDKLDANDWFANSEGSGRSPLRFNDFGGTLGGPIAKDNTFFFFSYEGQRLRQPEFAIEDEPDVTLRQTAPAALRPILNAYPVPNGPELGTGQAQFSAGYSNPITTDATSIRVDHIFSDKLTAFFRYNYAPSSSIVRGQKGDALSFLDQTSIQTQTATGGLTYSITPRLVNELRLNYSKNSLANPFILDTFGGAVPLSPSLVILSPFTSSNAAAELRLQPFNELEVGSFSGEEQRQVNVVDGLSYTVGAHLVKFGIDYLRSLPINLALNTDSYDFSDVADIIGNTISSFFAYSSAGARADVTNLSLYAQDTWRVSARLTLTYGLRWDLNPPPRDRYPNNGSYVPLLGDYATGDVFAGTPGSSLWTTKFTNFAPRLGVAYQLRQKPGWQTVVRAGAGLFYDMAEEDAVIYAYNGGFPNELESPTLSNVPFPITANQAAIPTQSLGNPSPGSFFNVYAKDLAAPRSWQWNLAVQQALGEAQTLTASYVAVLGTKLLYGQYYPAVGPSQYNVNYTDNSASSNYQSLQLQFQRRLRHGLTASLNYTWSHSLDDSSLDFAALAPSISLSPKSNWGPSDFDVRHNFTGAFSWSLPSAARTSWLGIATRGWGLDSIVTARSALPVDVSSYSNDFMGGYNFKLRPDLVTGVPLYLSDPNVAGGRRINPAAFVIDPNGQGDLGRNALRGFDLVESDVSVRRTFRLTERFGLLFRADLFNLFNHPNFASPNSNPASGLFGISTSMANGALGGGSDFSQNSVFQTGGPRSVQLSLKLLF
jgi:hypothetical protein